MFGTEIQPLMIVLPAPTQFKEVADDGISTFAGRRRSNVSKVTEFLPQRALKSAAVFVEAGSHERTVEQNDAVVCT